MCPLWRGLSGAAFCLACAGASAASDARLLEVWIDGANTQRVERFEGSLRAPRSLWRSLGLDAGEGDDQANIAAAELRGLHVQIDETLQTLHVRTLATTARRTLIERAGDVAAARLPSRMGVLVNYDLVATHAHRSSAAGLVEVRAFGAAGVLEHHLVAATSGERLRTHRLQTTFTRADPASAQRLRVGDIATDALDWTRPLRLAGVQHATDYALQPERIVSPTVQLSGQVALPSTVDLLINGVRQASQAVEAGAFEVRQVPVTAGAGEVTLVVRDALGRETLQSQSLYGGTRQLAPGVGEHALQIGRVRRGLDDYVGGLAASATLRRGWSDHVTLEAHAEAATGLVLAGAGARAAWWPIGSVAAAIAASRADGQGGHLLHLGWQRQSRAANAQLAWTHTSAGYRDLAALHGAAPPRHALRAAFSADFGRWGRSSVFAATTRTLSAMPRTRLVTGTHQWSLGADWQLQASAWRSFGAGGSRGVLLGLTLPFGERGHASTLLTRDRRSSQLSASAGVPSNGPGDFGWQAMIDQPLGNAHAADARQGLRVDSQQPLAHLSAEIESRAGHGALRVGVRGALVAVAGAGWHAAPPVADSVAVVDTAGRAGVAVYHENRYVGRTDAEGRLLVPGLLSHRPNRVTIDALDLPFDVQPTQVEQTVRPGERAALALRFDVEGGERDALVALRTPDGRPLPLGARVQLEGADATASIVGHDGLVYLRGIAGHNRAQVQLADGTRCVARFDATQRTAAGRIGPVVCAP